MYKQGSQRVDIIHVCFPSSFREFDANQPPSLRILFNGIDEHGERYETMTDRTKTDEDVPCRLWPCTSDSSFFPP